LGLLELNYMVIKEGWWLQGLIGATNGFLPRGNRYMFCFSYRKRGSKLKHDGSTIFILFSIRLCKKETLVNVMVTLIDGRKMAVMRIQKAWSVLS
jgi:hypothetical protein